MSFWQPKTIEVRKPADFDSVTDYLVGLSVEDITKLNKVVEIRRNAQRDCNAILGYANEPSTFIDPAADEPEFLDLLTDEPAIEAEQKPKAKKGGRKK